MDYERGRCICVGSLVKCVLCQVFVVNRERSQKTKTLVYQFIYVCTFIYENKDYGVTERMCKNANTPNPFSEL